MKNIRSLINLPVICSGKKVGRVVQVRLSDDLRRLEGLWVDSGLIGTRFIPAENISRIGSVAILADDPGARRRCGEGPLFLRALTTDGVRIGAISGAEVDETTFRVEALELTKGCFDDLLRGRSRVRRFTACPASGTVIIQSSGASGLQREGHANEGLHFKGPYDRRAHRRFGGDAVRHHELANGAQVEQPGQKDGSLGGRKG